MVLANSAGNLILDEDGRQIPDQLATVFVQRKEVGFGEAYGANRNGEWEYGSYRTDGSTATNVDEGAFAYLETEAQWASFTVREKRKKALELVRRSYPESEKGPLVEAYAPFADAHDGPDVFALYARRRAWDKRLKRDLSGVASVDVSGERASVVTMRGTRYPFRVRDNGIWGLTIFTADLLAEAERATRDLAVVEKAAADYDRARRQAPALMELAAAG
mgnify:CR=1 FL=1